MVLLSAYLYAVYIWRVWHVHRQYHLYNLSSDEEESHNLLPPVAADGSATTDHHTPALSPALAAVVASMNASLRAFAASVIRSQGSAENNCAEHFGPPPSSM